MLNLGNVSERIKKIIMRLRKPIDEVIAKIVRFIRSKLKGSRKKRKSGKKQTRKNAKKREWWKIRKRVIVGKQKHTVFFRGEGKNAKLKIQSVETDYKVYVSNLNINSSDQKKEQAKEDVLSIAKEIDELKSDEKATDKNTGAASSKFESLLDVLQSQTEILLEGNTTPPPSAKPIYGSLTAAGFGTYMHIPILTAQGPTGSEATAGATPIFTVLEDRKALPKGTKAFYNKGHLLSQDAHGPGNTWENLTPMSESGNQLFERNIEKVIKKGIRQGKVFKFTVKVVYGARNDKQKLINLIGKSQDLQGIKDRKKRIVEAEDFVASQLVCTLIELNPDGTEKSGGVKMVNEIINNDIRRQISMYRVKGEGDTPSSQRKLF